MQKLSQILNGFIANPKYLFIWFIIVNLLPTVGLLFTEPFNFMGKVVLLLFPISLYLLLFSLSKNIGLIQLLLFPLMFFHAFQIVVFYLFGEDVISADMFLNTVTTSVSEAGEVLDSLLPSVFFVVIVYVPTIIFASLAIKKKVHLDRVFRRRTFFSSLALMLITYGLSFAAKNVDTNRYNYYEDVYPVNMIYNLDFAADRWKMSNEYYKTSKDFAFEAKKVDTTSQREIYVLVVGETGRSENWSLYGYERETTPLLAQDSNLVYFPDAITQSNTTHKSVPILLSAASAEDYDLLYKQKSIIQAFNDVDFNTIFLSNQASNRTFTDFFAHEADIHTYHRFFGDATNEFDEILVDKMTHYIDSIDGNIFFVLHTYGSHFNYAERYPKEFARYQPDHISSISKSNIDAMVNAYDNTILYTDYVLNKVIKALEATGDCTAMFYTSDHGEDLLDDERSRFLHASPSPTFYQLKVPYVLWFSPNYKQAFPEKVANANRNRNSAVASNSVFHTVLDIAGITTNNSFHHLSTVSDEFKEQKRMYLDDHYNPIPYSNAGLKKQDKEMIRKRNMQF